MILIKLKEKFKTSNYSKPVVEQISEDTELIIQKRDHRYRAIIKNIKTNEMKFSNAYDTIKGLNKY